MDTGLKRVVLLCLAAQAAASLRAPLYLSDVVCNTTAYNESLGGNLTNRCDGVPCKLDNQCNSGFCVTNSLSKGRAPSLTCADKSFRPACNYSKLYQEYDVDEHLSVV